MVRSLNLYLFFISIALIVSSCGVSKRARKEKKQIETLVSTARSYSGTPYKYGGMSKSGIDCSGLVCQAYKSINIILPRTSEEQSKTGKKVKLGKLKEGDLLFFAMGKSKRKITHVGIVSDVSGKNVMFIHASSSQGVVEKDLMIEYYLKRLRVSRRILN